MEETSLETLKEEIDPQLKKQAISGRYLLDRFCLIDETSRKSPAYVDPTYAPFYYHLGKIIKPQNMIEIGFNLGLLSSSFMLSCRTVELFFGFKEGKKEDFHSERIGKLNLKKVFKKKRIFYNGNMFDKEFENIMKSNAWDMVMINEEKDYDKQLQYMETAWEKLNKNGILVIEYIDSHRPSREAFKSFADNKEVERLEFKTRYGTGIVLKAN
jgi:predicted O-methyltransferase YrrM